jgi:peroxiredoxin family protein
MGSQKTDNRSHYDLGRHGVNFNPSGPDFRRSDGHPKGREDLVTKAAETVNLGKLAIFLQSGDPERVRNAATVVAAAAALNWEVIVVLLGEALRLHVEGRLDPMPEGEKDPSRPSALIRSARDFGRVTLLACSADARRTGLGERRVRESVDSILGMPTILRRMKDAGTKLWI